MSPIAGPVRKNACWIPALSAWSPSAKFMELASGTLGGGSCSKYRSSALKRRGAKLQYALFRGTYLFRKGVLDIGNPACSYPARGMRPAFELGREQTWKIGRVTGWALSCWSIGRDERLHASLLSSFFAPLELFFWRQLGVLRLGTDLPAPV